MNSDQPPHGAERGVNGMKETDWTDYIIADPNAPLEEEPPAFRPTNRKARRAAKSDARRVIPKGGYDYDQMKTI